MTLFAVLAVLLPWSLWRQMHEHQITREGLYKLPIIFAAIGVFGMTTQDIPSDAAAAGYVALSLCLSVSLGVWRGAVIPTWQDASGRWMSKGNALTISLWVVLIAAKFAMGTVASITGWFPAPARARSSSSWASRSRQNLVVARRRSPAQPAEAPGAAFPTGGDDRLRHQLALAAAAPVDQEGGRVVAQLRPLAPDDRVPEPAQRLRGRLAGGGLMLDELAELFLRRQACRPGGACRPARRCRRAAGRPARATRSRPSARRPPAGRRAAAPARSSTSAPGDRCAGAAAAGDPRSASVSRPVSRSSCAITAVTKRLSGNCSPTASSISAWVSSSSRPARRLCR